MAVPTKTTIRATVDKMLASYAYTGESVWQQPCAVCSQVTHAPKIIAGRFICDHCSLRIEWSEAPVLLAVFTARGVTVTAGCETVDIALDVLAMYCQRTGLMYCRLTDSLFELTEDIDESGPEKLAYASVGRNALLLA